MFRECAVLAGNVRRDRFSMSALAVLHKFQKSSGRQGRLPRLIVVHVHTSGELVRLEGTIFRYGKQKSKMS